MHDIDITHTFLFSFYFFFFIILCWVSTLAYPTCLGLSPACSTKMLFGTKGFFVVAAAVV
uniref:Uncharacterized protein n=1 Tax=Arundo donax TaxID=35708 RepID=A0A0A9G0T5_ARUDO